MSNHFVRYELSISFFLKTLSFYRQVLFPEFFFQRKTRVGAKKKRAYLVINPEDANKRNLHDKQRVFTLTRISYCMEDPNPLEV